MEIKESRLRKLQALAERGVGGEAENARRKLDELSKKYDLEVGIYPVTNPNTGQ